MRWTVGARVEYSVGACDLTLHETAKSPGVVLRVRKNPRVETGSLGVVPVNREPPQARFDP